MCMKERIVRCLTLKSLSLLFFFGAAALALAGFAAGTPSSSSSSSSSIASSATDTYILLSVFESLYFPPRLFSSAFPLCASSAFCGWLLSLGHKKFGSTSCCANLHGISGVWRHGGINVMCIRQGNA